MILLAKTRVDHTGEELAHCIFLQRIPTPPGKKESAWYRVKCKYCGRIYQNSYSNLNKNSSCGCRRSVYSGGKCLYMAVSKDALELPVAVAETVQELAEMIGCSKETIWVSVSPSRRNKRKTDRSCAHGYGVRFIRVMLDEEEGAMHNVAERT